MTGSQPPSQKSKSLSIHSGETPMWPGQSVRDLASIRNCIWQNTSGERASSWEGSSRAVLPPTEQGPRFLPWSNDDPRLCPLLHPYIVMSSHLSTPQNGPNIKASRTRGASHIVSYKRRERGRRHLHRVSERAHDELDLSRTSNQLQPESQPRQCAMSSTIS